MKKNFWDGQESIVSHDQKPRETNIDFPLVVYVTQIPPLFTTLLDFPHLCYSSSHLIQPPINTTPIHPAIMSSSSTALATKRLFHEYKLLSQSPPDGITAGPLSEDDLFTWEALIQGPEGTPYEGGIFPAELKFPRDYPLSPPKMKFVGGELWHPNGTFSSPL